MDKNDCREKIVEMVTELENANKKAKTTMGDLNSNYFGESDPQKSFLRYYYDTARIKLSIALDYIHKTDLILKTLKEMIDEEIENS